MIDGKIRTFIDPPLNVLGKVIAKLGLKADHLTYAAMPIAILAGAAIAFDYQQAALILIIVNRIFDGLDGPVARVTGATPYGGFLDTVGDFLFYAAVPVGFAFTDPANALPAAVLLASFLTTGATFLAFAAAAKTEGLETERQGKKSMFYLNGVIEGAETIAFFVFFVLLPNLFPLSALVFAGLCFVTAVQRVLIARKLLENS